MIWRSVVGKLWVTILLLVSAVLIFLAMLLFQFFENHYLNEAEDELKNHADFIVSILERDGNSSENIRTVRQLAHANEMRITIFREEVPYWTSFEGTASDGYIPTMHLANHEELSRAFTDNETAVTRIHYEYQENGEEDFIVVAAPFNVEDSTSNAVFLYQSLATMEETIIETRRFILLAAAIAFVLTTFFAFFLSSRVTAPLRKMRQVSLEVAKGKFDTTVPMLTHDEIGQLAIAFNRMRRQLNNNISALNREKEQLSRILSSMADGVITINRRGEIVVTNPPAQFFLQSHAFEQSEKLGKEIPEEMEHLLQSVVKYEREQSSEITIQGRSYAILMSPLYDDSFVRGTVAVIRDMTEERQQDKMRKDFIANVSHELRTPIAMLQGYSEAMIDGIAQTRVEEQDMMQIIYDESLRMGRLVNELLDLARMEAGHMQLSKENIHAFELVEKVMRKFKQMADEAGVILEVDMNGENAWIHADPDRIEQVLTNLLHNALRHTDEGGRVILHVKDLESGVQIDVTDTGSGIPEEDLPFVFERFYKADKARTRGKRKSGTGLGLAIAKNIVQSHEGDISVQSKIDTGSTFTVFLPRK